MLLDQLPSLITPTALANTHCTFTFNLKGKSCVSTAARYTLIGRDDEEYFGKLPVGQAIVKLQGRWFQPFLIKIPHVRIRKGSVSDEDIQEAMKDYSIDSASSPDAAKKPATIPPSPHAERKALSESEKDFLQDILDNPLSGVSNRYSRLGLSRRRGTEIKEALRANGFIEEISIPLVSGRIVLLKTTRKTEALVQQQTLKKGASLGKHGLEHEFWKKRVRDYYERKGYRIKEEHSIKSGFIDLVAEGDERVAIEIETGNSNISDNISKTLAAHFPKLVLVPTNETASVKIEKLLQQLDPGDAAKVSIKDWKVFS